MAYATINPVYRDLMHEHGLTTADRILDMPGVVVCGHPDRHVVRVAIGGGSNPVGGFLKREHRVRWKDRLLNFLAGYGLVSKSSREAATLRALQGIDIGCPEVIAHGEDGRGRAFLLVRTVADAADLRVSLLDRLFTAPRRRLRLAHKLGGALAQFHEAGFDHPDLYSKHVLVRRGDGAIVFLDWQRSRRRRFLSWSLRWRDLAALDATLADELATSRERLACLRSYLRAVFAIRVPARFLSNAAQRIRRQSQVLLRRRSIREARQTPVTGDRESLIWLDGEALCVTARFQAEFSHLVASWLPLISRLATPRNRQTRTWVTLAQGRRAFLVRRRTSRPLGWLWAWLRTRAVMSPEARRVGLVFRLQRFGIDTARVLAFGQRRPWPWEMDSFLLTEALPATTPLPTWLDGRIDQGSWTAELKQRRSVVRQAGDVMRRLHEANCYFRRGTEPGQRACPVLVQSRQGGPAVVLDGPHGIWARRHSCPQLARDNLVFLHDCLPSRRANRTDQLRFLLTYLGLHRLTPGAKELVREIAGRWHRGHAILAPPQPRGDATVPVQTTDSSRERRAA